MADAQLCAGGVVYDGRGRLLLILRGHAPSAGLWSIPGGRCRPGEPTAEACVREVAEETGLTVQVDRLLGSVERDAPGGGRYHIDDYLCRVVSGRLRAGDDAQAATWTSRAQLAGLELTPGLYDALAAWDALPT